MMKLLTALLTLLIVLIVAAAPPALAAPATADVAPQTEVITLQRLGVGERVLRGPRDATVVEFRLPTGWKLVGSGALRLNLNVSIDGRNDLPSSLDSYTGTALRASLNGVALGRIPLTKLGELVTSVEIPGDALLAVDHTGLQRLRFDLDESDQCVADQQINVAVAPSSALTLTYEQAPLPISLSALPLPIYQGPLANNNTLLVVPDAPSAGELAAAFNVAAGLGRMTQGDMRLSLLPAGQLTDQLRADNHLIVVGRADQIASIGDLGLVPVEGAADDGVVQIGESPWGDGRAVLMVSGASDAAVIKAGQAVSSGSLRADPQQNLALVIGVAAEGGLNAISFDRTLGDLGYTARRIDGVGTQRVDYQFSIPPNQTISNGAYMNLSINHAPLIDPDLSTVTVRLNGQPIGSLRMGSDSTQLAIARLDIPQSAIRLGTNTLTIDGDLRPQTSCVNTGDDDIWMMIWPESTMHVALEPPTDLNAPQANLGRYPAPFTTNASLGSTAMVVAPGDPTGWAVAAQVAFDMGSQAEGPVMQLAAVYSDALDMTVLTTHHLLLVGQPAMLSANAELNAALPLDFPAGQGAPTQRFSQISYRLADDPDAAYIQLVASPWNIQYLLLSVTSRSAEGLRRAGEALGSPERRARLNGNVAILTGAQIVTDSVTALGEPSQAAGTTAQSVSLNATIKRPAWIIPAILISLLVMAGVSAYVIIGTLRRRVSR